MIIRLLQTELRSQKNLILLASAVSVLMWISETALRSGDTSATFSTLIYGQLPFPILVGVLGVRRVTQKRGRLLAQLPVSGIAARTASWLSYLLIVAIASLITAVMLALYPIDVKPVPVTALDRAYPDLGWTLAAAVGALMIACLTAIVALTRISRLIVSIRRPLQIAVLLAGLLVLVLLYSQWKLFTGGQGPFWVDRVIQWDLLGMAALGSAFALIVADILLDRLVDNRLC